MKTLAATLLLSLAALPAMAENRFTIDANVLIYNTSFPVDATLVDPASGMTAEDTRGDIAYEDIGALRSILDRNADRIDTMRLTSDGGYIEAAYDMAAIVADYGLKTEVQGECSSACAVIFAAGTERRMNKGGRIGLHPPSWGVESIRSYYLDWREDSGWKDEFAFSEWVYEEGQRDATKVFAHFINHGVSAEFAVKIATIGMNSMWYPTRKEMEEAGLLTPAPQAD
ncbi:hypothetical protein GU927_015045 [Rhodobacteraceae bacterium HSP-20]|uniref:Clp protease n=1 Tax=Paragemmobacter amnigenus TaxID=2852097 RepID=A0ABS6J7G8_9RHOB|nr:hypothetical protein [Rhodobacter amnigenus]MBU9699166.1 hypothetical protein [Rhodobacter amnigenus]MBV4390393.1 hypothetical protein [Rhodobacter amnigenus]